MKPPDWYADEASRRSIDEVRRLWHRGGRRPILLAVTVVGLLAVYGYKKSRPILELHTAKAAFIVREFTDWPGKDGSRERPPTELGMQEHLGNVLFNRTTLLGIMAKAGIYDELRRTDPEMAVRRFKKNSGFSLSDNGFADASDAVTSRSARLFLKFTHSDPLVASVVVETMAAAVNDLETHSREAFYDAAAALARGRLSEQQQLLDQLEARLSELRRKDGGKRRLGDDASTTQKLRALLRSMGSNREVTTEAESWAVLERMQRTRGLDELLIRGQEVNEAVIAIRIQIEATKLRVADLTRAVQKVQLSRAEDRETGIRFDLVDSGTVTFGKPLTIFQIILRMIFGLFLLVPAVRIVLGAFDPRVYTTEDLGRIGVKILGAIPAFPGDQVASLRDRLKSAAGSQPNPLS